MAIKETNILNYEAKGRGPIVVLLHGYMCSGSYWDNIRSKLEQTRTVITIDLLGFGKSPKPKDSTYDYTEHLAWIQRTLDHAKATGPVLMAGHSMGALLALRYSTLHPSKTSRLLLLNLPLFEGKDQARQELVGTSLLFRALISWRFHYLLVPVFRTKSMKSIVRRLADEKYKGMEEYMSAATGTSRDRSLRNVIEAQRAFDDLEYVSVPTTIVTGRGERQVYVENVEKLAKHKNIDVIFTDTGHHTPLEKPELIVELLQQK